MSQEMTAFAVCMSVGCFIAAFIVYEPFKDGSQLGWISGFCVATGLAIISHLVR